MINAVVLLLLAVMVVGALSVIAVAAFSSQFFYGWIRRKNTRPLTEEEKWQETSAMAHYGTTSSYTDTTVPVIRKRP